MKKDEGLGYVIREVDGEVVGSVHWDSDGPTVNVKGRVFIPRTWELRAVIGQASATVDYEVIHGAPEVVGIALRGYGLNTTTLDAVRRHLARWGELSLREVMARHSRQAVVVEGVAGASAPAPAELKSAEKVVRGRRKEITDEKLTRVAEIYAANPGRRHEMVAREFDVTPTTANKYIYLARKAGLIPDAPAPGKASR